MRVSRLYTETHLQSLATIALTDEQAHYLGRVLRAKVGQVVALFNGDDGEYQGEVIAVDKRSVQIQLAEKPSAQPESLYPVHIGLGLSKGERMDFAVQKATELGVTAITPLFTEHSEVKLNEERAEKRRLHWQKIAINACEQSGRCTIPTIHPPVVLGAWLDTVPAGQGFMLDHQGLTGFKTDRPAAAFLLIGPEGGISETEKAAATQAGLQSIRLGPRVLRTETAPVVALTAIQMVWGDF